MGEKDTPKQIYLTEDNLLYPFQELHLAGTMNLFEDLFPQNQCKSNIGSVIHRASRYWSPGPCCPTPARFWWVVCLLRYLHPFVWAWATFYWFSWKKTTGLMSRPLSRIGSRSYTARCLHLAWGLSRPGPAQPPHAPNPRSPLPKSDPPPIPYNPPPSFFTYSIFGNRITDKTTYIVNAAEPINR